MTNFPALGIRPHPHAYAYAPRYRSKAVQLLSRTKRHGNKRSWASQLNRLRCNWIISQKPIEPIALRSQGTNKRLEERGRGLIASKSRNWAVWNQGRPQRGRQWCPAPPFEICDPHFTFGLLVAAYIQYSIFKMWHPLLVFGPPCCYIPATGLYETQPTFTVICHKSCFFSQGMFQNY